MDGKPKWDLKMWHRLNELGFKRRNPNPNPSEESEYACRKVQNSPLMLETVFCTDDLTGTYSEPAVKIYKKKKVGSLGTGCQLSSAVNVQVATWAQLQSGAHCLLLEGRSERGCNCTSFNRVAPTHDPRLTSTIIFYLFIYYPHLK